MFHSPLAPDEPGSSYGQTVSLCTQKQTNPGSSLGQTVSLCTQKQTNTGLPPHKTRGLSGVRFGWRWGEEEGGGGWRERRDEESRH